MRRGLCAIIGTSAAVMAGGTFAQGYPRFETTTAIEVQFDDVFESGDPDAERRELFTKIEPEITLGLAKNLSITAGLVFEPVADPGPREDRYFEDHGLFAEVWSINFDTDRFSLYGGKFNPNFALGFDLASGIYGEDLPEEIELTERIGVGASVTFGLETAATATVGASVFFADTSFLSGSLLKSRGRLSLSDGGAGNTEDLSSYVISLDIEDIAPLPGFGVHVAYRHQSSTLTSHHEDGIVVSAYGSIPITQDIALEPFFEFAHIDHFDAGPQHRTYWTGSTSLLYNAWRLDLSYSRREVSPSMLDFADTDGQQFQATAGYLFDNGLLLETGYAINDDVGVTSHIIGARLSFELTMGFPARAY